MTKQIQKKKYDSLSKIYYCTHWHIDSPKLLLCLYVLFYSSFVYTYVCVFLHIQSPLRECRSIRSGASGLPYYCAPLVYVSEVIELLAVCRHDKPKTKNQNSWCNCRAKCVDSTTKKKSIAGVPFDSVRRFRATLLLCTTCMHLWCNWVASCVAV